MGKLELMIEFESDETVDGCEGGGKRMGEVSSDVSLGLAGAELLGKDSDRTMFLKAE